MIAEIKRIHGIAKAHVEQMDNEKLGRNILSVQREYVQHVGVLLAQNDELIKALSRIDTHGIAVEEATHDELVQFIAEIKNMANDALMKVGERLSIGNVGGINKKYRYWELWHDFESLNGNGDQCIATHWSDEWYTLTSMLSKTDDEIKEMIKNDIEYARDAYGEKVSKRSVAPALKEFKKILQELGLGS